MKVFHLTLAIIFLAFAAVQLNDPDPVPWTAVYLSIAVSCAMAAFQVRPLWWLRIVTILILLWTVASLPGLFKWLGSGLPDITGEMKASTPVIEEMREFLGLLIGSATMLHLLLQRPSPGKPE